MPRLKTTPEQRSGYRMERNRQEDAFNQRDTRGLRSPFASQPNAMALGIGIVAVIGIIAWLLNVIMPKSGLGDATYVATSDGGQYVKYNEVWHPVTNPVSARLITGEAEPKNVDQDALKDVIRGLPMGIASAPEQITATDVDKADTTVCSIELGTSPTVQSSDLKVETALLAQDRPDTKDLGKESASLVTVADESTYWLLFDGKRAEVSMSNDTIRAALGITKEVEDNATVVSPKLLNAIPAQPEISVPQLENMGQQSSAVQGYEVGTVFAQEMPNEPSTFYVVTDKGIQPISAVTGRILATSGSEMVKNPSVSIINNATRDDEITQENYPEQLPEFVDDEVVCATWLKESNTSKSLVTLSTAKSLNIKDEDVEGGVIARKDLSTTITGGDGPSADRWYPGHEGRGWFYRTTDLTKESITEGPVWYVSADGVRYPIGGDSDNEDVNQIVEQLGLKDITPVLVPWQYMSLLPEGQTLSPKNALVLHETIDPPSKVLTPKEEEENNDDTGSEDDTGQKEGTPDAATNDEVEE